jgi:protein-disulfide isomerase
VSSGSATRENRQAKAAMMRAKAAKAEARRRLLIVGASVLAIMGVVIAGFVIVQNARRDTATASTANPANLGPSNSITVGQSSAPATVVIYEDFLCPFCNMFEQANASQFDAWVKAGTVKIEYRPIAFLDSKSSDAYSTRALNAVGALINSTPSAFPAYHKALFANQPEEGGPGLTDQKLIDLAVAAGAPKAAMTEAVNEQTFKSWTVRATESASKDGVNSTPTVLVNGKKIGDMDAAAVKAAVDAAVAAAK